MISGEELETNFVQTSQYEEEAQLFMSKSFVS